MNCQKSRFVGALCLVLVSILGMASTGLAHDWTVEELFAPHYYSFSSDFFALDHQNKPHIAIGSVNDRWDNDGLLRFASRVGEAWQFETVSDETTPYPEVNLAFDALDAPHIICWDTGGFRHFYRVNDVWESYVAGSAGIREISGFGFDNENRPHLVFMQGNLLKHGVKTGSEWTFQVIATPTGYQVHRAIMGDDGFLRVAFVDTGGIYVATINGTGSEIEVEFTGQPHEEMYILSITLDAANHPHLAYGVNNQLYYVYRDETTWHEEMIDNVSMSNLRIAVDQSIVHLIYSDTEKFLGLTHRYRESSVWLQEQLDDNLDDPMSEIMAHVEPGVLHIAYFNDGQDLRYGVWSAGSWNGEFIECGSVPGFPMSLAVDESGKLHIGHGLHDVGLYGNHLGYITNKGGEWVSNVADVAWADYAAIALTTDDQPVIISSDYHSLRFGRYTSSGWVFQTLATGDRYLGVDIDVDREGKVGISYWQESAGVDSIRYAFLSGGEWTFETVQQENINLNNECILLQYDLQGTPWISYHTNQWHELTCAHKNESEWVFETINQSYINSSSHDMKLDPQGRICIAYPWQNTLYLLNRDESVWEQTAVPIEGHSYAARLTFDTMGNPHVVVIFADPIPETTMHVMHTTTYGSLNP